MATATGISRQEQSLNQNYIGQTVLTVAAVLAGLLGCRLGVAGPATAQPAWVTLDPDLHRQADRTSIERQGPWVQFSQSWGDLKDGRPGDAAIVERMAVNCLTGAYAQTEYPASDPKTRRRIVKRQSFEEIEHAQDFESRLLLSNNATPLGRALIQFACTCHPETAGAEPTQEEMQVAYDRYMAGPLSKVEFHLQFLRVPSERIARDAIAELASGKPFEMVADEHASPADALSFPHGDLGAHLETEWPIDDVRRYRTLKVGESSHNPHPGIYGWEVVKLQSTRTLPAPTLADMRPRLQAYLVRAHACGWVP